MHNFLITVFSSLYTGLYPTLTTNDTLTLYFFRFTFYKAIHFRRYNCSQIMAVHKPTSFRMTTFYLLPVYHRCPKGHPMKPLALLC